ncbi:GDSL-type esterase/lipase family protein [Paenibacillus glycanilyticus]|uniref:SGNH hydrolase-type esterase domain-containing protein n=1 Tax=Paenibacillus glycanilyticus TaxID=126569 RepID=A0ABQ6GJV8_9BACL|nr:GDSL-type esterase/lipase family protein [Paenibacillus glycanilyticus]GLX69906.1 hypothetical protein MU1_42520 [Paenibacillus glycanilyticus]
MNLAAEGNKLMKADTVNTAVIPATKLEEDSYDWWERHEQVLKIKDEMNPEIVLVGDSITHFWGGLPAPNSQHGTGAAWDSVFEGRRVLNLGFGWDRTQNVLWRLDNGQMEGLSPEWVVINIGTNNTSGTDNARASTAEEVQSGVRAIVERVRKTAPSAQVILMAVFPREESPADPRRLLIGRMNELYTALAAELGLTFLDIGKLMLAEDGTLPREIAFDTCHLTEQGYQLWADALREVISAK